MPDNRLRDALHPPECAAVEIIERYTLRTFLALPKIRRITIKRDDPFGLVDEKGREFRGEPVYFIGYIVTITYNFYPSGCAFNISSDSMEGDDGYWSEPLKLDTLG